MILSRSLGAVAAVVVLSLASHGGPATAAPPATAPATAPDAPALPDSPAGDQMAWVLVSGGTASADDWAGRLGPAMLEVITPQDAVAGIASVMALAGPDGFAITAVDARSDYELTVGLVGADETAYNVDIAVAEAPPHLIELLNFAPGDAPQPPVGVDEIRARLAALAPATALLVTAIGEDPLIAVDADQAGPVGSAFKLYVLGAVVDAIAAGEIAWTDELLIADDLRSLPSGELQDRPAGSSTTVEEAATLMISISDNTAADLLIDRVGVEAVERQMAIMGASQQSIDRTLPFLTTRQFFTLKWSQDDETLARYAEADAATRRMILADLPSDLPALAAFDPATPVVPNDIEWFSSPNELGSALVWLDVRSREAGLEPVATVLGTNPGVDLDPTVWTAFAFKGGSEPGVISLSWLLTRSDGVRFVVSLRASDDDAAIDESEAVSIAVGAIELAAAG